MKDADLTAVADRIGTPRPPTADVLARARERAGLNTAAGTLEVSLLPLAPRRRRRALTAAALTAAAAVALATVGVLHTSHSTSLQPTAGAATTFPSDAELADAHWLHMTTMSPSSSCPGGAIEEYWFSRDLPAGSFGGDPPNRPATCAPLRDVEGRPAFPFAGKEIAWSALPGQPADPTAAAAQLQAQADTDPDSSRSVSPFVNETEISLYNPAPIAQRKAVVAALLDHPGVSLGKGLDSLGRAVTWVSANRTQWVGIDTADAWATADGSGTNVAGDGPTTVTRVFTAIDTAAPPADITPGTPKPDAPFLVTGVIRGSAGASLSYSVSDGKVEQPQPVPVAADGTFSFTLPTESVTLDASDAAGKGCGSFDFGAAAGGTARVVFTC